MAYQVTGRNIGINANDIIAVQEDVGTSNVVFSIPLSESSVSLTTLAPFVIYKHEDVVGARFKALTNMRTVGNNVEVTWSIDRNTTARQGKLQFQVVFTDSSSDPVANPGNTRWASKICRVVIPESLYGESYPAPSETLIAQIQELAAQIVQPSSTINNRLTAVENSYSGLNTRMTAAESDIDDIEANTTLTTATITAFRNIGYDG